MQRTTQTPSLPPHALHAPTHPQPPRRATTPSTSLRHGRSENDIGVAGALALAAALPRLAALEELSLK